MKSGTTRWGTRRCRNRSSRHRRPAHTGSMWARWGRWAGLQVTPPSPVWPWTAFSSWTRKRRRRRSWLASLWACRRPLRRHGPCRSWSSHGFHRHRSSAAVSACPLRTCPQSWGSPPAACPRWACRMSWLLVSWQQLSQWMQNLRGCWSQVSWSGRLGIVPRASQPAGCGSPPALPSDQRSGSCHHPALGCGSGLAGSSGEDVFSGLGQSPDDVSRKPHPAPAGFLKHKRVSIKD